MIYTKMKTHRLSFTSPPFIPLQGESLQGEPLSINMERGIGGEVFKMSIALNLKEPFAYQKS